MQPEWFGSSTSTNNCNNMPSSVKRAREQPREQPVVRLGLVGIKQDCVTAGWSTIFDHEFAFIFQHGPVPFLGMVLLMFWYTK
jgi:hypothetical protein